MKRTRTALFFTFLLSTTLGVFIQANAAAPEQSPQLASKWVVQTTDGKQISLEQEVQQGNKVVVIFWATWCQFCRGLLPQLNTLHQASEPAATPNEPGVRFIAMNLWEDTDPIAYMATQNITIPTVLHTENIAKQYGVRGTPGVFVIGQQRRILYHRRMGQSTAEVMTHVKSALAQH